MSWDNFDDAAACLDNQGTPWVIAQLSDDGKSVRVQTSSEYGEEREIMKEAINKYINEQ